MAKPKPVTDSPKTDSSTSKVDELLKDYDAWQKYSEGYRKRWHDYWKLWNNERIKRQYNSKVADSFDPMAYQVVESRVDNIYGSRPKLTFLPTRPEQETDTKILTGHWDYCWDKSNMDLYIVPIGREQEITGNVCVFAGWGDGCMTMTPVPMPDCILDPAATRPEQMRFVGYRRLDTITNLEKAKRFDADKGWIPAYQKLDQVKTWTADTEGLAKKDREKIYSGSTLPEDQRKDQLEVIYLAYRDTIYEIGNRHVIIAQYDNPFQAPERTVEVQLTNDDGQKMFDETSVPPNAAAMNEEQLAAALQPIKTTITIPAIEPFLPVAVGRHTIDLASLLAKGTVEPFAANQEDLNDEINIKKDNLISRQQNTGLVDKDQAPDLIPLLASAKPSDLIPAEGIAAGRDPIRWIDKPELSQDTDIEIGRLKQSIRDTARVDRVVQGASGNEQGGNDRTATEVNAQVAGASSGFNSATRNLESGLYKQLGELYVKMVQIFLTEEQLIRVVGKSGAEFKKFDPSKYFGEYDVKVVLESQAQAAQKQDIDRMLAFYQQFKDDPNINQIELKKKVAQTAFEMDEDDVKLLFINPSPTNQAVAGGVPVGDVTDGTGVPPPFASMPPGAM